MARIRHLSCIEFHPEASNPARSGATAWEGAMLNGLKNLVHRDGHGTNGHGTNGLGTNGHGTNGHHVNDDSTASRTNNGHGNNGRNSAAPDTGITIPDDFMWTLEVRRDQELLGCMHSLSPFVLISFFRDYSMLYGEPTESYAVWLRHKESNRGAPMQYQQGEAAWIEFLRKLDPEIDDTLEEIRGASNRTSMLDPQGRPTHPDAVLELAFGLGS
jgi:hypothetical protein